MGISSTVFRAEYQIMLRQLKAARENAGLTQYDLAKNLGKSQSYVGKCELGERRLDLVQLRDFCDAIGIRFVDFILAVEAEIEVSSRSEN